jgi:hypothetical protein
MARAEAGIAAALGAPAGTFASDLAGGVHAKAADGHENMFARLHPDGDEAAMTSFAIGGELLAGQAAVQQSCLDEDVRSAAGAVISAVFNIAMAATKHIRLVLEGVGSINGELESLRSGLANGSEAAVEADLRIATDSSWAGGGSALSGGALGGSLLSGLLLGVVVGPGLSVGLLSVVGGPSLSVGSLLLSVSGLGLRGSIVTGGIITILGVRGGSNCEEADGEGEADECFHGCVSGSCFC